MSKPPTHRKQSSSSDLDASVSDNLTVEYLIKKLGGWSKFQKFNGSLLSFTSVMGSMVASILPFLEIPPQFECHDPSSDSWLKCSTDMACSGEYDKRTIDEFDNLVTQFELYCDRAYIVGLIGTCFFLGALSGPIIGGTISDKYGRKMVAGIANTLQVVGIAVATFSPSVETFLCAIFFFGFFMASSKTVCFVLFSETVDSVHRNRPGIVTSALHGVVTIIAVILFAIISEWRILLLLSLIFGLPMMIFYPKLTHSPRQVIESHGKLKNEEMAQKVFAEMASMNQSKVSKHQLQEFVTALSNVKADSHAQDEARHHHKFLGGLFHDGALAPRTIIMMMLWLVCGFSYFGLAFQLPTLTENVNDLIMVGLLFGVLDTAATWWIAILVKKYPKKKLAVIFFWAYAIVSVCFPMLSDKTQYLAGACVAKFLISAAYGIVYILAPELFPTRVRNTACGLVSTSGRVGSTIAPMMVVGATQLSINPSVIFGIACGLVSTLGIFLPSRTYDDELSAKLTSLRDAEKGMDSLKQPLLKTTV